MRTIDLGDDLSRDINIASAALGMSSAEFLRSAAQASIWTMEKDEDFAKFMRNARDMRRVPLPFPETPYELAKVMVS